MSGASLLDPQAVARLFEQAESEVSARRLPSCQVAIARGDEMKMATFGAPGDARFVIFSITKALIAGAVWVLFGDGALAPSTPVVDVIPEFGANGKQGVTVEHLLTHTAGFPRAPMRPEEGASADGRAARFARWRLDWEPGTATAYHPTSAHWVLADLVERVSGQDFRAFLGSRILRPLGLTRLRLGVGADDQADVVDVAIVGDRGAQQLQGPDLGALLAEAAPSRLLRYNEATVRAAGVPGAGAVGSAEEVARYFQALLRNDGQVWDRAVVQDAVSVVRNTLVDPITKVPANRTLGLVVAGDDGHAWMREVGRNAGPRTFVASGIGGQVAWADPDSGLSFCFLTSGIDVDLVQSFLRSTQLSTLAADCA